VHENIKGRTPVPRLRGNHLCSPVILESEAAVDRIFKCSSYTPELELQHLVSGNLITDRGLSQRGVGMGRISLLGF
jgi:hypothetical protein